MKNHRTQRQLFLCRTRSLAALGVREQGIKARTRELAKSTRGSPWSFRIPTQRAVFIYQTNGCGNPHSPPGVVPVRRRQMRCALQSSWSDGPGPLLCCSGGFRSAVGPWHTHSIQRGHRCALMLARTKTTHPVLQSQRWLSTHLCGRLAQRGRPCNAPRHRAVYIRIPSYPYERSLLHHQGLTRHRHRKASNQLNPSIGTTKRLTYFR